MARLRVASTTAMGATTDKATPGRIQVTDCEPAGSGSRARATRPTLSVSPGLATGSVTDGFARGRPAAAARSAGEIAPARAAPAAYVFPDALGCPHEISCLITRARRARSV